MQIVWNFVRPNDVEVLRIDVVAAAWNGLSFVERAPFVGAEGLAGVLQALDVVFIGKQRGSRLAAQGIIGLGEGGQVDQFPGFAAAHVFGPVGIE